MNKLRLLAGFGFVLASIMFVGAEKVSAQRGSLEWEGSIDDRANLVITGRRVRVQTLSGQRNGNGRSNWSGEDWDDRRGMGRGKNRRVDVDKLDGRGRVRVVQQPSRSNNFTTIISIDDDKGGRDRYRIRVNWN
ncbi:MAG: hypothetical protein ABIR33_08010 [Pyrinomonadaceae bacterium]